MIVFRKVENSHDPLFSKMYELYVNAFPAVERRTLSGLEGVLNHDKRFAITVLLNNSGFVGFLNYWLFEGFVFAEHFAVSPNLRGGNIGSEVMKTFFTNVNLPVVFEVEIPENELAIRRIAFYERLGCKLLSQKYAQPHYDGSGKLLPMLLMTNNYGYVDKHFNQIKTNIYTEVYKYREGTCRKQ
jgi:ribosomal protein S18 acetylase RimI-like enzyme